MTRERRDRRERRYRRDKIYKWDRRDRRTIKKEDTGEIEETEVKGEQRETSLLGKRGRVEDKKGKSNHLLQIKANTDVNL